MKKIVNILSILSVVSVLLMVLFSIIWDEKSVRLTFIFDWVLSILFPLAIPLIFRSFSLVAFKDKIKPKLWLSIYGCAVLVYLVIIFGFGYIDIVKDLPLAVRESYSLMNGEIQTISDSDKTQTITVGGKEYTIYKYGFKPLEENITYQFIYLPNSKVVIDVIEENGSSLLKDKK